jgi:hypothetical protein
MLRLSTAQVYPGGFPTGYAAIGAPAPEASAGSIRNAAVAFALAGLAMALVGLRGPIVRLEPRSAVLFDALGLHVNLVGLDIARTSARILLDGDRRVLIVEGEVANATAAAKTIPPMKVAVRSADGQALYVWTTQPTRQRIEAGERGAFSARLVAPPLDGADVVVEFERPAGQSAAAQPSAAKKAQPPRFQGSRTESQ